ncbi:hypothetical protein [Pseudomonas chlororaphis]|uniref:Uncharacterized protein n=1 Tax=Pseudomonas chlororaphis O6 TaxID=1037915 RepID=A0AB33WS55_9PSED|nr:hypothetical protein [Pseudomonas chlororaphis]EIM15944.1 hypothetical protein PchlO6_1216 [Pseudomonas chlororaphis O6]
MNTPTQNLQQIARAALNELETCKQTLWQMEALFISIKKLGFDTAAENLVGLGASVCGDIGILTSDNLDSLEARYCEAISAPQNTQPEIVSRHEGEVRHG